MRDGAAAHLRLCGDEVVRRVDARHEPECAVAEGIVLEFGRDDVLVGILFADADRLVPPAPALRAEWDRGSGAAYVYLVAIAKGGVASTAVFGADATRPAWGINLDFDGDGRLVGIEFERDWMAPREVLDGASRIG